MNENYLPEGLADQMKLGPRPRFQIWKNGAKIKEIDGVLIDEIEKIVQGLLPNLDDA